jgi:hypothetical protein
MTLDYSSETPTRLRPATKEQERFLSYSYLVFEPAYLAELALTNGLGRPLDFIPRFASPDPLLHEITAALSEFHFARLFKAATRGDCFPVRDPYTDGAGQAASL